MVCLGDSQARQIDVQIVCATHRELTAAVAEGRCREDLFYRVAGRAMHLLPLRERDNFDALLEALLRELDVTTDRVDEALRASLRASSWPGNVRQLFYALKRAIALSP